MTRSDRKDMVELRGMEARRGVVSPGNRGILRRLRTQRVPSLTGTSAAQGKEVDGEDSLPLSSCLPDWIPVTFRNHKPVGATSRQASAQAPNLALAS
jgi:hypothetical protein